MSASLLGRAALLGLALFAALLISGCATVGPDRCAQFERDKKTADYHTIYTYSKTQTRRAAQSFARRPRRSDAAARWYTLRFNRTEARSCEHLYLIKDLYLERSAKALTLEEQRDFYTAGGQRIASKRENLTHQLTRTGYYTASVPLPIPRDAPSGTYRIITYLIATPAKGRARTLATTAAEFQVR